MDSLFTFDIDGPRATITLKRPEQHNIIRAQDLPGLIDILNRIASNRDIRAVLLTGTKAKVFSSGFDINSITSTDWSKNELEEAIDRMEAIPQPTVCALTGSVYGGATDLALSCDFRIGITGMELWVPAAALGVHYHINGLRRFTKRLGPNIAKRIFLLGDKLDADLLLSCGYLDALVKPNELAAAADSWISRIIDGAPLAVNGMKTVLNGISRDDFDEKAARNNMLSCLNSSDVIEGVAAFTEGREPKFRGR